MAIWIELRCERRGNGRSEYERDYYCWSDGNSGPGELTGDTRKDMSDTYNFLSKAAKASGWKNKRGEGWVCPCCLAYEAKVEANHDN